MSEIRLIHFTDSKMKPTLMRIKREAEASGFFTSIRSYTEKDLGKDYWQKYKDRFLQNERLYGYALQKSHIVKRELESLADGDILVYLDSGCAINARARKRFDEYIELARHTDCGVVCFEQKMFPEREWCKADLLQYAGVLNDPAITETPQFWDGGFIIRKCALSVEFVDKWYDLSHNHFNLTTDEPSALPNLAGFRENRHDQSAFSVLLKPYKPCILDNSEIETFVYNPDGSVKFTHNFAAELASTPFWATRNKKRTLAWRVQDRLAHPARTAHNALKKLSHLVMRGAKSTR